MLNHAFTQTLTTPRLILRRFTPEDAPAMYRNWASDPQVTRFLRWTPHPSVQDTRTLLEGWTEQYSQPDYYNWAVERREDGVLIGSIGAFGNSNPMDEMIEIGYCLGTAFWGQGYMTEALEAVLDFLFGTVGYRRIEAYHSTKNPASGRVMEKAGMIYEGTARQKYMIASGEPQDCRMYGILRSDWEAHRAK